MINDLVNFFKDKKILILGFGREGQSTYKFIRKYLQDQHIYIADQKDSFDILNQDKNITLISGPNYMDNLEQYDVIMKTPGISFVGLDTSKFINKVKSELELLLEFFDSKTIGVTGTKGKSTTSSLIYKVLKDQGIKTLFLGNIGIPAFDFVDDIEKDTTIVLEMSSHQLEFMKKSPNISILLNAFPEHLDHYESYEKYVEAKCNIYKYQNENDYFMYNIDNETLNKMVNDPIAKTFKVSLNSENNADIVVKDEYICVDNEKMYNINNPRKLKGSYNLNNIMFVIGVAKILGLDLQKTSESINSFETLPHRLEFVGKYDDVLYYDNSIATIPQATIEAVKALENVNCLIIGGMDRGIDYTDLINFINKTDIGNIVCLPKTGHDIASKITNNKVYLAKDLFEAVSISKKVTEKGKICLLSPAAASYGFFKNFEERGDKFKELVKTNEV